MISSPAPHSLALRALLALVLLAVSVPLLGTARAQSAAEPIRVVVLPFDIDAQVASYQLGLPTALQHSLNQLPGVYVPPVGDAALMANKAADLGQEVQSVLQRVFNATAVVTGRAYTTNRGIGAEMNINVGGRTETRTVEGESPAAVTAAATTELARLVAPGVSEDALAAATVAAEATPSLASLGPTGLAASGLPGSRVSDLHTAAELDASSAWVAAQYARGLALVGEWQGALEQAQRAAQLAPENAEVQATLGIVLEAAGQPEALEAFEHALRINPAHAVALVGRAAVKSSAGAAADGVAADLEAAIRAYPRFVDAYIRLAELQPDRQRALQTLRRAESYSPESALLRGTVMQELIDGGDAQGARAYLQQALADPLARSASMYALAGLLPANDAETALALVREGRDQYPESVTLRLTEADILLGSGDATGALGILGTLHTENPGNVQIARALASAQAQAGDLEAARTTYETLAESGIQVEREIAELYLASGRAAGAISVLEPLIAALPEDAHLLALHGTALMRMGRLSDAERELSRALELDAGNTLAARSLELVLQQRELTGGDVAFAEESGVAFQQGLSALDLRDYAGAAEAFGRSRAAQETGLGAFYQGYARQLAGEVRAAVADYEAALEQLGENDTVLNNLGYGWLELGRYDRALEHLTRAVAANPDNPQAHLNLGVVYYALQRYDDSIAELEEAARLDPRLTTTVESLISDVRRGAGQP